jgi:hypothetical protein
MRPSSRNMGAARLQWQVVKLHLCACRCPAAAAGSQTAVTVMQWQDTKLHAQNSDPGHILFLRIYILSYITAKKVI